MRKAMTGLFVAVAGIGATSAGAQTAGEGEPDRTLAPYFVVPGGDGSTESLPLKETSAEVAIAGVIARVKVKQQYENTGKTPIEAVYVFPASTRAAVHGMRMKIGERTIEAKIERRRRRGPTTRPPGRRASAPRCWSRSGRTCSP